MTDSLEVCCLGNSARYKSGGSGKRFTTKKKDFCILPGRFDNGDFESWLREFDACCAANGWKTTEDRDDKILKLPAFLRGQSASHFYAIPAEQRATYATAVVLPPTARTFMRNLKAVLYDQARIPPYTSGNWKTCSPKPTIHYQPTQRKL